MYRVDWLSKWIEYFPNKIAIKEFETEHTMTYQQLQNVANRISDLLVNDYKMKKGDRVAILAENSIEHLVLFFVCQKTGMVLVPLNYRLATRELEFLLNDSSPAFIIYEEQFEEKIKNINYFKNLNHKITIKELSSLLEKWKNEKFSFSEEKNIEEDDPIFILYTAGTTGQPKGALYTHKMLFWNSINTTMRLDITSDDRSVSCTPMFHTGGWNVIPTSFLHRGAYICITKKFDADIVLKLLEKEKATMFMAVPTMIEMMAKSSEFEKVDLTAMKYFIIGGEPLPLPLIEKWHKKGIPIRQGYGLTEAGPSITSLHQDDAIRKIGSIGKPNFYIDIKIIDDNGNDVPKGEVGEFLLKGPSVTIGYWKNAKATEESIRNGWFYTGDLVKQDEENFIYVVDRKKNMFISGGENIYPAEIEKSLYTHPDILEVAVIGIPDEKWGEIGKAFIVKKKNSNITEQDIIEFCKGNIANYKIPKQIQFIAEIPKSAADKVDRKKLLDIHLNNNK